MASALALNRFWVVVVVDAWPAAVRQRLVVPRARLLWWHNVCGGAWCGIVCQNFPEWAVVCVELPLGLGLVHSIIEQQVLLVRPAARSISLEGELIALEVKPIHLGGVGATYPVCRFARLRNRKVDNDDKGDSTHPRQVQKLCDV